MPRRLVQPSARPIWIAVALALLLFAIALVLAWWRIGSYDGSVARNRAEVMPAGVSMLR